MSDNSKHIFSLYQVCKDIEKTLDKRYKYGYWIKAEINKLNHYTRSGHCYPELVEKRSNRIVAQIRAVIWKTDFERIEKKFKTVAGEPLKDDIKILLFAYVDYHPQYGLSLKIRDIDPNYTVGDLMQAKQKCLEKLKAASLINRNKELRLPVLPQRIAIISVETSKGYADFINILDQAEKEQNIGFFRFLFPAILQGDRAIRSILRQLKKIRKLQHHFDLVAIIRGGGGEVGLSCFNDHQLAKSIATFPLPVFTGIGHSTNRTVAEMVSYYNAITPTKIAEYLIGPLKEQKSSIGELQEKVFHSSRHQLNEQTQQLHQLKKWMHYHSKNQLRKQTDQQEQLLQKVHIHSMFRIKNEDLHLARSRDRLGHQTSKITAKASDLVREQQMLLKKYAGRSLEKDQDELENFRKAVRYLHPDQVLKRGYSITRMNGRSIKHSGDVQPGDQLETLLFQGKVKSTVNKKNDKDE